MLTTQRTRNTYNFSKPHITGSVNTDDGNYRGRLTSKLIHFVLIETINIDHRAIVYEVTD